MTFNVGDRVKLKPKDDALGGLEGFVAKTGTVTAVQLTGFLVIVQFDGECIDSPIVGTNLEPVLQ